MPPLLRWQRRLLAAVCCTLLALLLLLLQLGWTPGQIFSPPPPPRVGPVLPYHEAFEYLLNPAVCGPGAVRVVVVVHSDPRHPEVRQAIRASLPADELARLGVRRAFMLADASTKVTAGETTVPQSAIVEENAKYGDVVQGNFHDSYHNLTYKHIMALDWAITFCPQARFIVKMDDDIVYNVYELLKMLQFLPATKFLGGNVFAASPPFRGDSKWQVSTEEWPRTFYPPYLSGWLYVVTQDVARALVLQSTVVPFFWIDDTYVTGILVEQLPITVRGINKLFVTSAGCVKYTVKQRFSVDRQSDGHVYRPNFVIGPSDKDLDALQAFNRLSRYCHLWSCQQRSRRPLCRNNF